MRSLSRLFSICLLAGLFLALPSSGAASAPGGAGSKAPAGPAAVAPSLIPGARVGSIGVADLLAYNPGSYGNVGSATATSCDYPYGEFAYNTATAWYELLAPFTLPAGATLWQVDVYGCANDTSSLDYYLFDLDATTGRWGDWLAHSSTPAGPGPLHQTMFFSSGFTLANGHEFMLGVDGTSSKAGLLGVVYQYTLPSLQLYPITPIRVFDSRFTRFGGVIAGGTSRLVNVKNSINVVSGNDVTTNAIPVGAKAISFTLTITGTVSGGWLAVLPGTSTSVTASTINWYTSGQTLATGGMVMLGSGSAERQVTIVGGGSGGRTQAILDITGYYE